MAPSTRQPGIGCGSARCDRGCSAGSVPIRVEGGRPVSDDRRDRGRLVSNHRTHSRSATRQHRCSSVDAVAIPHANRNRTSPTPPTNASSAHAKGQGETPLPNRRQLAPRTRCRHACIPISARPGTLRFARFTPVWVCPWGVPLCACINVVCVPRGSPMPCMRQPQRSGSLRANPTHPRTQPPNRAALRARVPVVRVWPSAPWFARKPDESVGSECTQSDRSLHPVGGAEPVQGGWGAVHARPPVLGCRPTPAMDAGPHATQSGITYGLRAVCPTTPP